ncbi:hypothetical protein [Arthrobacter sp. SX1312]|uniref:hypothetical protein n=1 Tax=Arthrobacter sp. SX1312 TaxID=2058896 RepID=UPI0011B045BA|nr:hypothetical protein [Arthrobacter sp. SX1312]
MDNRKSARLRGSGESREFRLRLLIPAILLVLLLFLLVGYVPREALVPAIVVVGAGLLISGAVGVRTGIRGPAWLIYGVILAGLALLLLAPAPWRGFALLSVPVSAIGYVIGKELAFFGYNRRHQASPSAWVVAGEAIDSVAEAKQRALSRLGRWESLEDGRFVVVLGHRRFEAWGAAAEGFVVHIASDGRDLETLSVLTHIPHQNDEVSIRLDTHGLTGRVPQGVKVPTEVAEQALNGFFETQGAKDLTGWAWESGAQAQDLRFS